MSEHRQLEPGKKYVLDKDFQGGSIVEVVASGKFFCRVRAESGVEWNTMCYRLTDIEEKK